MSALINLLLAVLALPALLACGYLLALTLLSAREAARPRSSRALRFDVFVPAHNEEPVIARTVMNLKRLDWPADRFRIIVIADNCSDQTARIAVAAGARVYERTDSTARGKGYALAHAFARSAAESWADAVVVIDADAEASANLLEAFASRIEDGACAVQAHYGVLNPLASWRTRLITIAKGAFHIVRSRARERLGVSCGIRGNGWCVTHQLLQRVPYKAFSLTEDVEYGIEIGLAGYRVRYADEAHSNADMVSGEQIARKQRARWEQGRFQLIRTKTLRLLSAAVRRRSAVCLDLGLDLLVLPLSYVALNIIGFTVLASLAAWWQPSMQWWLLLSIGCIASLVLYVVRGWQLSGIGAVGLLDLARAPAFLLWKLVLMAKRGPSDEWVRTEREKP
ncbi:MAG: glycosyltransferase family 2 protein [Pseudomonadota bacterium]|nr:glycosyltransferase family 2 protein [Pseudomonadota bacterium]